MNVRHVTGYVFMRTQNILLSVLLCCCHLSGYAQSYYQYKNTFNITRSSQTAFNYFVILAPCPQSNEYQNVYELDCNSSGTWIQHEIAENQNKYLELNMDATDLSNASKNYSVGYSFIFSPKSFAIDFSPYKHADGSWGDMPEYDTSSLDYKENTKQSGEIVVPDNETIVSISNQIFTNCSGNKLAYAEKCYEYVASHYRYLNPNTGLHPLSEILANGGGDCGNFSSIYISLLRAKGIPARHVVAFGANNNFHVWSEFYIQDFGWVPVDVTYKNSNPQGNYFGRYNYNMVVVQKGVSMDYPTASVGTQFIDLLQTYYYWYWYNTYATMNINQTITAMNIEYNGVAQIKSHTTKSVRKILRNNKLVIEANGHEYNVSGQQLK